MIARLLEANPRKEGNVDDGDMILEWVMRREATMLVIILTTAITLPAAIL